MHKSSRGALLAALVAAIGGCGEQGAGRETLGTSQQRLEPVYSAKIYWCCGHHTNPAGATYPVGVGKSEEDVAQQLANFLNAIPGQTTTFTIAKLGPTDPLDAGIYLVNAFDASSPAIPTSLTGARTQLATSTLPAYSLSWDASSLWVIGHSQGVRNGAYDYLHRLGYRWLLPSANWQITPPSGVSLTLPGSGPGVVEPALSTFTFGGQAEPGDDPLLVPGGPTNGPSLWTEWLAHNRFTADKLTPKHSYASMFASRDVNPRNEITLNKLALPEIGGVRTVTRNAETKIHYTGRQTFLSPVSGATAMYTDPNTGTVYYESLNDYSYDSLMSPPPSGAVKGILQSLASEVASKLDLVASDGWTLWTVEPSDGHSNHCDCIKCRQLLQHVPGDFTDEDGFEIPAPPSTDSSVSDRVFFSANAAATAMKERYGVDSNGQAKKGVALLAYSDHAPVPHIPILPNVMVWPTPYAYHRLHTGKTNQQQLEAWQRKAAHDGFTLGAYDYVSLPNGLYGGFRENVLTMQKRLNEMRSYGINDVAIEGAKGGGTWGPTLLFGSRMAWVPTTTAASMLDTFVMEAFGPTASPAVRPIYAALYEQSFANDYLDLHRLLSLFPAAITAMDSASAEQVERFRDLESFVHYLRLLHDGPSSGMTDVYHWLWCIDGNQMLPTRRITELLQAKFPNPLWTVAQAPATLDPSTCVPRTAYDATIVADVADFPLAPYREVTFARDASEYMLLPPTWDLPNQTYVGPVPVPSHEPLSPKKGFNHLIFAVTYTQSVFVNVAIPATGTFLLQVTDSAGDSINSTKLTNPSALAQVTVPLGTLPPGNYEIDFIPDDASANYRIWTTTTPSGGNEVGVPLAYKDGVTFYTKDWAYFYVPAEVETFFLRGVDVLYYLQGPPPSDGSGVLPVLRSPTHLTDPDLEPLGLGTFRVKVNGRPGIWRVNMTAKTGAHLVNLPDVFSVERNYVITSKRIRTAMEPYTTPSEVQVMSPTYKYNNRFNIRLTSALGANQPLLSINTGTSLASPPPISARLLDQEGKDLPGSPFSLVPGGANPMYGISTTQSLPAGDYELQVTNPNIANGYGLFVPPSTPVVSVDGYGMGNVNAPSYRSFFTVPRTSEPNKYIYFVANPTGAPILMYSYNSAGQQTAYGNTTDCALPTPPVTCPQHMGNNVYKFSIPSTVDTSADTLWAMNLKGQYWSNIRLLNAPQIMTFVQNRHLVVAPSP